MKKLDRNNVLKNYSGSYSEEPMDWNSWEINSSDIKRGVYSTKPNIVCECGNTTFGVCWWDYPFTGGYCKIVCSECGEELILINDYS